MTQPARPAPLVDSWSCPTTVYAAPGALAHLPPIVGGGPAVVVTDSGLWPDSAVARRVADLVTAADVVVRQPDHDDARFFARVRSALLTAPGAPLVALGGGSVLDVARAAAVAVGDARFDGVMVGLGTGELPPLLMWPDARSASNRCVAVPTTLGTAAEASPVAVVRHRGGTTLLVGPGLRAQVAILDPLATSTLPEQTLRAGLVEPLSRLLVPTVASARSEPQDGLARALIANLIDLGAAGVDHHWRLSAALTSTATHTSFISIGRSPFGHSLWPFATEITAALPVTKPVALAWLIPAWLHGLATGALGQRFGDPDRVPDLMALTAQEAVDMLPAWFAAAVGPDATPARLAPGVDLDAIAADIAAAVQRRWLPGGFFLPGVSAAEVTWLTREAVCGRSRATGSAG